MYTLLKQLKINTLHTPPTYLSYYTNRNKYSNLQKKINAAHEIILSH